MLPSGTAGAKGPPQSGRGDVGALCQPWELQWVSGSGAASGFPKARRASPAVPPAAPAAARGAPGRRCKKRLIAKAQGLASPASAQDASVFSTQSSSERLSVLTKPLREELLGQGRATSPLLPFAFNIYSSHHLFLVRKGHVSSAVKLRALWSHWLPSSCSQLVPPGAFPSRPGFGQPHGTIDHPSPAPESHRCPWAFYLAHPV